MLEDELDSRSQSDVLFVVHGLGTGRLKSAVLEFLRACHRVNSALHITANTSSALGSRFFHQRRFSGWLHGRAFVELTAVVFALVHASLEIRLDVTFQVLFLSSAPPSLQWIALSSRTSCASLPLFLDST